MLKFEGFCGCNLNLVHNEATLKALQSNLCSNSSVESPWRWRIQALASSTSWHSHTRRVHPKAVQKDDLIVDTENEKLIAKSLLHYNTPLLINPRYWTLKSVIKWRVVIGVRVLPSAVLKKSLWPLMLTHTPLGVAISIVTLKKVPLIPLTAWGFDELFKDNSPTNLKQSQLIDSCSKLTPATSEMVNLVKSHATSMLALFESKRTSLRGLVELMIPLMCNTLSCVSYCWFHLKE